MNKPNRIDTATIEFVDEVSDNDASEIRRYIDLLQDDGKLAPPVLPEGVTVEEYVFDDYSGCFDARLSDGRTLGTMGADGVTDEWQESDERNSGKYPTTTEDVGHQTWV